jgi:CBS domain-containing protein
MDVAHAMNRNVKARHPHDSLNQAAQLRWDNACGCVPVVDGDNRLVGFLTDRDICMAAYT